MKQTMLIVGLGLIGGSLALALKGFEDFEIVGVDVSQPTLRYAAEHGVGDRVTEDAAAEMALCAIADAMYEFAQEDERRGLARVSIGSVSETYTAPPELCARTLDDRARHYRREAGYYYSIGRWVNNG